LKNEDMDMYARVLADALAQGERVADSVKFYNQFGSQDTREHCLRKGYLEIFQKAGARVLEPTCGTCINAGPGVSTRPDPSLNTNLQKRASRHWRKSSRGRRSKGVHDHAESKERSA
jgi:aconitase A